MTESHLSRRVGWVEAAAEAPRPREPRLRPRPPGRPLPPPLAELYPPEMFYVNHILSI